MFHKTIIIIIEASINFFDIFVNKLRLSGLLNPLHSIYYTYEPPHELTPAKISSHNKSWNIANNIQWVAQRRGNQFSNHNSIHIQHFNLHAHVDYKNTSTVHSKKKEALNGQNTRHRRRKTFCILQTSLAANQTSSVPTPIEHDATTIPSTNKTVSTIHCISLAARYKYILYSYILK